MSEKNTSLHYQKYLQLDKILDAQMLESKSHGNEAHEEMLFIIIHQAYELWFKQILHELESVMLYFSKDKIDEENIGLIVSRIERANKIMDVLVDQIDILETMTSLDFLDFRHYLSPASGFQSHQFRRIELLLGLKINKRHQFGGCPYHDQFEGKKKDKILDLEKNESLFSLIEKWLERIPFLNMKEFDFIKKYEEAINIISNEEISSISKSTILNENDKKLRIRMIEENMKYFHRVLDEKEHLKAIEEEETSLSYKATMSALLINLYRDEPILHLPYRLLKNIVVLDHKVAEWRFRHVQMVEKMLGQKIGTGGSSGQGYLKETVDKHKVFTDFANIATLMISRSYLPKLPTSVKKNLGYVYSK